MGEGNKETDKRRGAEKRREKVEGGRYSPENATSERAKAGGELPREEEQRVRSGERALFTDGCHKKKMRERGCQGKDRVREMSTRRSVEWDDNSRRQVSSDVSRHCQLAERRR